MPQTGRIYCEPFAGLAALYWKMALTADYEQWRLNDLRNVPYRCAPESDLSSAKAVQVNRDTWSRGNFVFHLLQVIHRPDSKDCFFRCLRMIARFSQSTR